MTFEEKLLATKIWSIRLGVAFFFFAVFYVILVSTVPVIPVKVISTDVRVREDPTSGFTVLEEQHEYFGYIETDVSSSYTLHSESDPNRSYVLHGMSFETRLGAFSTYNTIILPNAVTGKWCLKVSHSWWPSLSQKAFVMPVANNCFEIK